MINKIAGLAGAIFGLAIYLLAGDTSRRHKLYADRLEFVRFSNSEITVKGVISKMELKEGQRVKLNVAPKTSRGHAASIEAGSGRWSSSDEAVVSVEQDPTNELVAIVRGVDGSANESVVIEFRGDADRSPDGVREIIGTLDVVCTQGDAAVVEIEAGTPEADSDATPATGTDAGTAGSDQSTGNIPADGSTGTPSDATTTEGTDTAPQTDENPPA